MLPIDERLVELLDTTIVRVAQSKKAFTVDDALNHAVTRGTPPTRSQMQNYLKLKAKEGILKTDHDVIGTLYYMLNDKPEGNK